MPTVLVREGFRFFFYSNEGTEPPHIHVEKGDAAAKFWLDSVALASSAGMSRSELRRAAEIVYNQAAYFKQRWEEFFS